VDIARSAEVTLVVLVPGMGDEIQALKAGIMEIGEVFVVNKADHPGAEKVVREIRALVADRSTSRGWTPRVVATVATSGQGIGELAAAVREAHDFFQDSEAGRERRLSAERRRILELIEQRVLDEFRRTLDNSELDGLAEKVTRGETTPYEAAELLRGQWRNQTASNHGPRAKTPRPASTES
jgi:LAO/AO transport system kinase